MKKTLLVILVLLLAASPLALAACSNVSQAQLLSTAYVSHEGGYELFSYDVYYKTDIVGEMTLKFEPLKGAAVELPCRGAEGGVKSFSSFTGTLLSMDLAMNGVLSSDTVTSRVIYSNSFTPSYSYKKTVIGGVTKEMQVSYSSKYARTELFENGALGATSRQKIKNTTVFDNEMLYAVIRATKVDESSYSLSFASPNALIAAMDQITVSKAGTATVKIKALAEEKAAAAEGEDTTLETGSEAPSVSDGSTPAYVFKITTGNRYASSYSMEIAKDPLFVNNEYMNVSNVKKAILKITEGDYSYILKGITIA